MDERSGGPRTRMPSHVNVLIFVAFWTSLHHGSGFPLMEPHGEPSAEAVPPIHRARPRRCACSNRLDSECHYFCHLDILWVNTPSKTTVYGLGGKPGRRKRSAGRCSCSDAADRTCAGFCSRSLEIAFPKGRRLRLLGIFRALGGRLAKSNGVRREKIG